MRLSDFISANTDEILDEWDTFARSVWPDAKSTPDSLRDHAAEILGATVRDMNSSQSNRQQREKSKGLAHEGDQGTSELAKASEKHAASRVDSGFGLMALLAEYRALRATVLRLWAQSHGAPTPEDLKDITRFNESIDESLTEAIRRFSDQISQSRDIFLGILGHDLRNPLNAIMLSAHGLSEELGPGGLGHAATVSQIASSAETMGRMLGDFLDFAGSRLGRDIPITTAPMDLGVLCKEVVAEMRAAFPDRTLSLHSNGDLAGEWDPGRLRQILSNLIGNAVQHGAPTSPISISAEGVESGIRLAVRNEGRPIPRDLLSRIFDPLARGTEAEPQARGLAGSMGLGLYIAREVVEGHEGSIEVQSSTEEGTVFTVLLPRRLATK